LAAKWLWSVRYLLYDDIYHTEFFAKDKIKSFGFIRDRFVHGSAKGLTTHYSQACFQFLTKALFTVLTNFSKALQDQAAHSDIARYHQSVRKSTAIVGLAKQSQSYHIHDRG
jgi:hypothetical protein